jgi:hypothetical protein
VIKHTQSYFVCLSSWFLRVSTPHVESKPWQDVSVFSEQQCKSVNSQGVNMVPVQQWLLSLEELFSREQ